MPAKFMRVSLLMSALFTAAALGMSTPALADAIVLRSVAKHLPAGTVIRDGQLVRLSRGVSVLLLLPNGQTQVMLGPLRKRYGSTASPAPSMISAFVAMFKARASNEQLGGVRNGEAHCMPSDPQDWEALAAGWNAGCRHEALAQLSVRLNSQTTAQHQAAK